MPTGREKMLAGELYDPMDVEIALCESCAGSGRGCPEETAIVSGLDARALMAGLRDPRRSRSEGSAS